MFRLLVLQGYQDLFTVLLTPSFYSQTLFFLSIFVACIFLASFPYIILPSKVSKSALLTPIFGFLNLLFILNFYDTVKKTLQLNVSVISFFIFVTLFQSAIIFFFRRYKKSAKSNFAHVRLTAIISLLFFLSYLLVTARHFDTATSSFFVPGYNINHDAMNILASVKAQSQPPLFINSNLMQFEAHRLHTIYPLGGTYLTYLFSSFFNSDPYFIYSRLITASTLIVLYASAFFLITLNQQLAKQTPLLTMGSLLSFWNFFTLAMVNSSVIASTLAMLTVVIGFISIIHLFLKKDNSRVFYILLFLSLSAGIFLYTAIPILIVSAFFVCMTIIHKSKVYRTILPIITILLLSFMTHHNSVHSTTVFVNRLISPWSEANLLMPNKGNVAGFLNLTKALSLWISHPIHTIGTFKSFNAVLVGVLSILTFLNLIRYRLKIDYKKLLLNPLFSIGIIIISLLSFTYYVSRSPYQNTKVLQLIGYLFPLGVTYVYSKVAPTRLLRVTYLSLCASILVSALLNYGYIGKPLITASLELQTLSSKLCSNNNLGVISRDEWALYWFYPCSDITIHLNRVDNFKFILAFLNTNGLKSPTDPCSASSLTLPLNFTPQESSLIIDNCINFSDKNYTHTNAFKFHSLYQSN